MSEHAVIGGGFFGLYLAEHLALQGGSVTLFEREKEVMQRASYVNQARIHNGYHYPRSLLTAMRSRVSFPRFVSEFPDAIDDSFEKYYLIGRILSKVTAAQFLRFCRRIEAPCDPAPGWLNDLVNPRFIEAAFATVEYAFNARAIREAMLDRLNSAGVNIQYESVVTSVRRESKGVAVQVASSENPDKSESLAFHQVFNCTYSMLNDVNRNSDLPMINLKHELAEVCLVDPPPELRGKGLTVMCGPFFSMMPFPDRQLHSFTHVRYTPHYEWLDSEQIPYDDPYSHLKTQAVKRSNWGKMQKDAQRYLSVISGCKYRDSLWEVKTVLPRSETDDSRPILFRTNHGIRGYHCLMGGKVDNVYEVIHEIANQGLDR